MPTFTRALLIGVNQQEATACEADAERWRWVLTQPQPAPALPAGRVVVLTGGAATRAAALHELRALAEGIVADRRDQPDAAGVLVFSGLGCRIDPGAESGLCFADGELPYDDLVEVLDQPFQDLAQARRAAGGVDEAIKSPLPMPRLLAVLDTASVDAVVPPGRASRARAGTPPVDPDQIDLDPERRQPRLRYHARQIAPQGACFSWEGDDAGTRQGEITRWFAPWFADHHASIALFGQEIGAGTSGLTIYGLQDPAGARLGTALWTNARDVTVNGTLVPRERALWHIDAFPQEFSLIPLPAAPAGWPGPQLCLDAENLPFSTVRQGMAPPASTVIYALRARPTGHSMGYMGLLGPLDAPTGQWWAAPFGVIDNHGFFIHEGPIHLRAVTQIPEIPGNWRVVITR